MKIPLCRPYINAEVKAEVMAVLDSGMLTEGSVTRELEKLTAGYVGSRHAQAVTSCTTGLEIALRCLGIGPGHEVIVPDYTYPATAHSVAIVGATPVLVDVDPSTMLIDLAAARQAISDRTRALIPVSLFGNPLDYEEINSIKREYGLFVVEDAACALGARIKNKPVGSMADISVFSFHPRKFVTTGEGGVITTDNEEWAAWIHSYCHFGMDSAKEGSRSETRFVRMGTNSKLSNIQAAIGVAQMRSVEQMLDKRTKLANRYLELLAPVEKIRFPEVTNQGRHSYQSFCVFVKNRDRVINMMREKGIEAQIGSYALHMHEAFIKHARIPSQPKSSKYAFDHCLALPLFQELTEQDQALVAKILIESVQESG